MFLVGDRILLLSLHEQFLYASIVEAVSKTCNLKIASQILIGYALVLFLFGIVTFVNRGLSERVNENTEWFSKSENVIRLSAQLHRGVIDMENAMRGFLLTGKESLLLPYYTGKKMSLN